jgi:hypothetical protein
MRVLTLLLAVAVAMASAELAPANRQLLSLQEVLAKLALQLRTDLLKLESAIPAELKPSSKHFWRWTNPTCRRCLAS